MSAAAKERVSTNCGRFCTLLAGADARACRSFDANSSYQRPAHRNSLVGLAFDHYHIVVTVLAVYACVRACVRACVCVYVAHMPDGTA